jgi:hypothetical protein
MSRSPSSRKRRRGRGQALVEFAFMAPIIFLVFIVIIEAGRFVFYYHVLNNAAREGARYAIVHGENAFDGCPSGPTPPGVTSCDPAGNNIRAHIRNKALDLAQSSLSFGWSGDSSFPIYGASTGLANNSVGNDVTVRLEYAYSPIVLLDLFGTVNIRAEATLVINN